MSAEERFRFNRIHRNDYFEIDFARYQFADESKGGNVYKYLSDIITKKKYTIKDTDATYRAVYHWSKLGLFDDSREENTNGWRKFNTVDIVWLKILSELRGFGVSLDKIKNGYHSLIKNERLLEYGIFLSILRKSVHLVVFPDGFIELATRSSLALSEAVGTFSEPSYLVISLNYCLQHLLPKYNFRPDMDTFQLSKKEKSVLYALRGNCDEISVHKKDGNIDRVDSKSKYMGDIGKLSDILNVVKNGEFTIKKQEGKILFIERIKKEKV